MTSLTRRGSGFESLSAHNNQSLLDRVLLVAGEEAEIADVDCIVTGEAEESRDACRKRLVDEDLQPAEARGSSRSSTAAAAYRSCPRGGYHISSYRQPQSLAVGEGAWVFSFLRTQIRIDAVG